MKELAHLRTLLSPTGRVHCGGGAEFVEHVEDDDIRFRTYLSRVWNDKLLRDARLICWVMLNPSVANAERSDATVRRCIRFSKLWGYDGLMIVNLFDVVATDPKVLPLLKMIQCRRGTRRFEEALSLATTVLVAFGNVHPRLLRLGRDRIARIQQARKTTLCLGHTQRGLPRHPVRLAALTRTEVWNFSVLDAIDDLKQMYCTQ